MLAWATLTVLSVVALLLILDVPLALVVLAFVPGMLALSAWFRRRSALAYRATRDAIAEVIVHFVETLNGIRAVQAFRRQPRNDLTFRDLDETYRGATAWTIRLGAVFGPGVKLLGNIALAAVLLIGGTRALDGRITVGVLTAFLLYLRRLIDPILDLSQFYTVFQSASAALDKLSAVLEEPFAVAEPPMPSRLPAVRGDLRLEGVTFGYGHALVLRDLDLTIPAGQIVAVVGETGAGKSTIARLLARLSDPLDGRVLLDGIDLRRLATTDLRRAITLVTQEGFLFSGSVAYNIALGSPGAGRTDIEHAARAIGAHACFAALAQGYDTDVRRRGARLSSGQRQLVSFARAFLRDPRVLVLDEATSSLDIPSERLVQRALQTLLADRTAVIIAHRLTTVEIADRVLVLDGGRVVEDGAPGELAKGTGHYAALHRGWLASIALTPIAGTPPPP